MYRVMSILNTLAERRVTEQSYLDVSLLEVVTEQFTLLVLSIDWEGEKPGKQHYKQWNWSILESVLNFKQYIVKIYSLTLPVMF